MTQPSVPSQTRWMRLFGSSIIDQAMLSAVNFIVGLMLIRHGGEDQYGYYVLAFNAILLLTMLQNSFIGTPLLIKLPKLSDLKRRQWLGSLLRDQNRCMMVSSTLALAVIAILWANQNINTNTTQLLLATVAAMATSLYREFFRNALTIYQRPQTVLWVDMLYAGGLVLGCMIAIITPVPALLTVLATSLSALFCAKVFKQRMQGMIDPLAPAGKLRAIAPIGLWSASGACVYWLFNQGYSFVTAFTLDIAAVSALAATRLLMMPVNLICSGIQKQLSPSTSYWLHTIGVTTTLHRLLFIALLLGLGLAAYTGAIWLARDWIFLSVLQKDYAQRDLFLLLWAAIFLLKAFRDPPMLILMLRQRFRILTGSSSLCAVISLLICFFLTQKYGPIGALFGILAGEALSLLAVLVFAHAETRSTMTDKQQLTP